MTSKTGTKSREMSSGALGCIAHYAIASRAHVAVSYFSFQNCAVHIPGPRYEQEPYFAQLVTMHREIVAREGEDHRMPDWLLL